MSQLMTDRVREGKTHGEIIEELQASASASREVEPVSAPLAPSLLAGVEASEALRPGGTACGGAAVPPQPSSAEDSGLLTGTNAPGRTEPAPNAVGAGMEQERLAGLITRKSPAASAGPATTAEARSDESPALPFPRRKAGGVRRRFRGAAIAPAPWHVERSGGVLFVVGADGRAIATVIPRRNRTEATAALLAASPVMLAAIELVADGLDGLARRTEDSGLRTELSRAVAALRSAQDIAYGVGDPGR